MVDGALSGLFRLVLPERCSPCRQASTGPVCAACREDLPWNCHAYPSCARPQESGPGYLCASCPETPPPVDAGWSTFRYQPPIDLAVQGLKYNAGFRSAHWPRLEMARALA